MKYYRNWNYSQGKDGNWMAQNRNNLKRITAKTETEIIKMLDDEYKYRQELAKKGFETRRQSEKWKSERRIAIPVRIKKLEDEIEKLKIELEQLK